MATKKVLKKAPEKAAKKSAKKASAKTGKKASKTSKKSVKKAVKASPRSVAVASEAKEISIEGLQALRDEMEALVDSPRAFTADEAKALATRVHDEVEMFLMACRGVGNGQSTTKISVVPSGGN